MTNPITTRDSLELLESMLISMSIESDEVINEVTNIIQRWINNTRNVKGYCRT